MWAKKAQRWRKKNKRAVSPIIATILLVAITVVLAAVLYVLISGLTRGPGNTTLGSALALGVAAEASQTTGNAPGTATACAATVPGTCWTFTFSVESAGGGITWNGVDLTVTNATGQLAATAAAGADSTIAYAVLNIAGQTVCSATFTGAGNAAAETTWTAGTAGSGATAISSTQTLVVTIIGWGGHTMPGTAGQLNALGVGSYSGTIHANIP